MNNVIPCVICKQQARSSMGYFYGACMNCAKKAIDTAAKNDIDPQSDGLFDYLQSLNLSSADWAKLKEEY